MDAEPLSEKLNLQSPRGIFFISSDVYKRQYVYILLFDRIFFGKPITMRKVGGNAMIIAGIIVCLNR